MTVDDLMMMTEDELEALVAWMVKNKTFDEAFQILQQAYLNS